VHQPTRWFVVSLLVLWACAHPQPSQAASKSNQPEDPPAAQAKRQKAAPEIPAIETQPGFTIRARATEVLVRVVVRDAQGKAVPTLTKDDFRLLDNGKPQVIREFSVEFARPTLASTAEKSNRPAVEKRPEQVESAAPVPERFVALYFDDTFIPFEDVVRTRDAATHYLKTSITPGDRVGLYTSSGVGNLEFTRDLSALDEALAKLRPHPSGSSQEATDCPYFSEYESYLISEEHDPQALELGVAKVIKCLCTQQPPPAHAAANTQINRCPVDPEIYAESTARRNWERAQFAVRQSLGKLRALVRRLSAMPGQRSIVWVSPGFLGMGQTFEMSSLIDQALRARVVINALDSRGLWVLIPGGDASQQGSGLTGRLAAVDAQYAQMAQGIDSEVMIAATSGTGGVFVHDTNDYDSGFRRVGALPEVAYLLSFSPQNLKYDGKYHNLKVELVNGRGLSLQARKGYFAPAGQADSERLAKEDLQEAVFSRDERKDLPLEIQTQFFMTSKTEGQLSVLARVDLNGVLLHKEQQRNVDELRFVTALFDENGNLLEGQEHDVDLRLKDATLNKLLEGGLKTSCQFKVRPGTYVVREVVRDMGSGGIAALSRTVEIPHAN
jgi:VWFA-related protein